MSLLIRRARIADAAAMARHMGDPAVFGGLLQMPFPSEDAWVRRLTDGVNAATADVMLIAERDGELIGAAGLDMVSGHARRRHAMGVGIHVAPRSQGEGVGSALMAALRDYADRWAGVLRWNWWSTPTTRPRSGSTASSASRSRAHALRNGVYADALAMARLHPSPPSLPTR